MRKQWNRKLVIGLLLLLIFLILGVVPQWFTRYGPFATDVWHASDLGIPPFPPSHAHWLGTDDWGRDTYTQILYGILPTLLHATILVAMSILSAFVIALVTTLYEPRWLQFLMKILTNTMTVIPPVILAILILELPPVYFSSHIAWWYFGVIGVLETARFSTVMEGDLRLIYQKPFVEGAITAGNSSFRIFRKHMFPWILPFLMEYIPTQYARILTIVGELAYFGMFSNVHLVAGQYSISVSTTELDWSAMIGMGGHNWFSVPGVVFFVTIAFCILIFTFRLISSGVSTALVQDVSSYWPESERTKRQRNTLLKWMDRRVVGTGARKTTT